MITETVTVNEIEMSYFSFGEGERAFVILPGLDTKSILNAAKAVATAYRAFGEKYTVYVFDRRRNMPEDYTITQMADDTAAVMEHLGIADADIFGASQGGMIAMCLAIGHPQLVHAMVLGSTAAYADPAAEDSIGTWIALAERHDMPALTADFIDRLYSETTIGQYKELLIHMNDNVADEDIRRFIICARAIEGFDIRGQLHRVSCPTLVIGCLGDKVLPADASREIAELLGSELYLYGAEYGHSVFDEAPDYKERLMHFFESVK